MTSSKRHKIVHQDFTTTNDDDDDVVVVVIIVVDNVECREPNFEDSDQYIDTWQESLGRAVTTDPPPKSGCKMPKLLPIGQYIVPRSVFVTL